MAKTTRAGSKEPTTPKSTKVTAPAPPKKVVKKTNVEPVVPAPVPDVPVIPLETHEKVVNEKKKEVTSAKYDRDKWKERAEKAEATVKNWVDNVGDKVGDTTHNAKEAVGHAKGWLDRGNKWAFAAVPIIILGVWLFIVYQQRNNALEASAKKDATIEWYKYHVNTAETESKTALEGTRKDVLRKDSAYQKKK